MIPILHSNCWASDTCKENPDIQLDVALYQVLPTRYKVLVQMKFMNTCSNDFLIVEDSTRKSIRTHKSVEGFKILKQPDKTTNNAIYEIEINDKGFSTGATRIMTRVEGTYLYPLMSMPVRHKDGGGIEYLSAVFDDQDAFERTSEILDNNPNINVLFDEPEFKSWSLGDNMWHEQKTVFTEFLMSPEMSNVVMDLLSNTGNLGKLYDETGFLDSVLSSPIYNIIIKSMTGISILNDFYDIFKK